MGCHVAKERYKLGAWLGQQEQFRTAKNRLRQLVLARNLFPQFGGDEQKEIVEIARMNMPYEEIEKMAEKRRGEEGQPESEEGGESDAEEGEEAAEQISSKAVEQMNSGLEKQEGKIDAPKMRRLRIPKGREVLPLRRRAKHMPAPRDRGSGIKKPRHHPAGGKGHKQKRRKG